MLDRRRQLGGRKPAVFQRRHVRLISRIGELTGGEQGDRNTDGDGNGTHFFAKKQG